MKAPLDHIPACTKQGVCIAACTGQGECLQGGVCQGVPAQGVSALGGGFLHLVRGVSAQGVSSRGCLPGGVSAQVQGCLPLVPEVWQIILESIHTSDLLGVNFLLYAIVKSA